MMQIHDAATIILLRQGADGPRVLMGQRGKAAVFMPDKFVFPGGRVDAEDFERHFSPGLREPCRARLAKGGLADALAAAAIRELWEETGLVLGKGTDPAPGGPLDAASLRFVFRAITPPGRSRRFDARFFLASAAAVQGDLDDFDDASDELSYLHWIGLAEARALALPFITEVVLSEIAAICASGADDRAIGDRPVPFFSQGDLGPTFTLISGAAP